tara:strand:- start:3907 stop:4764 length:858 start_codon:yes stop_codon:yes gene_type:complete
VKTFKIKSFCKINLFLKVVKKLSNGYHNIVSLITFCNLHDIISISKTSNLNDKISFTGDFKKGINTKSNTATDVLNLLRQKGLIGNQKYKINIQKNIPHGSGLGGGSSNAANLLNYFNKVMKLRLDLSKLEKLASQIGSDVPISLIKKNTFLSGKKGKIQRLKKKFKLNLLIVYPNVICSTKKIYMRNKKISPLNYKFYRNRNEKLINLLKKENNDLEKTVIKMYPKINKVIKYIKTQKGCYFSRITGSGSACIGIFSNMKNALYAKKLIKIKYPKYWCVVSKTM